MWTDEWVKSKCTQVWHESWHLQLLISIMDSTSEQMTELGVSFQLDFHQVNSVYAPSSIYIAQQFLQLLFVYPNQTPLLSSSGLTEEKL